MVHKPRVLVYDIETAPNIAAIWGKYEQNAVWFESEWYIMAFGWRWLDQKTTHVLALPDFHKSYKKDPQNDYFLIKELHDLLGQADIVIAHNGRKFDNKKANARFLFHNLKPPSGYHTIDTLVEARKYFNLNSNKLDDLGEILNVGRKKSTGGYSLWKDCLNGNAKAWRLMKQYCKQDVNLLVNIYFRIRPWITNHPNINTPSDQVKCLSCGSTNIHRNGYRRSKILFYQRIQCMDCGAWGQLRQAEKTKKSPITN